MNKKVKKIDNKKTNEIKTIDSIKKILLICIPVILIIVGVSYYMTYLFYPEDAKVIKQLINGINQSMNQYNEKGYEISFKEKYNVVSKNGNKNDLLISYEGEGNVKLSYELDNIKNPEPYINNLIAYGNGYLIGSQKEKMHYYYNEEQEDEIDYEINHDFSIIVDDKDYYVNSKNNFIDKIDSKNKNNNSFTGKIDKNLLKDSIPEEKMKKAIQKLMFMDTWDYINQLTTYINNYFKTTKYTNAKQIKDFIKDNEIKIEKLDKTVKISFKFNTENIILQYINEKQDYLPKISGFMEIEKDTGNVLHYEYDFKDYLLAILEKDGKNKKDYKANVEEFIVEGRVLNSTLENIDNKNDYKDYSDNKTEFLKKFSQSVFPFQVTEG